MAPHHQGTTGMGSKVPTPATLRFANLPGVHKRPYQDDRGRDWEISKIEWIRGVRWCRARRYGTKGPFREYRLEIVRRDGGLAALRGAAALAVMLALVGCSGDLLDDIEDRKYDAAAEKVSAYCAKAAGGDLWLQRTRIEARREIRQRGSNGPVGPLVVIDGLDLKTAHGSGPVLVVWCEGERTGDGFPYPVPPAVWQGMVRQWSD